MRASAILSLQPGQLAARWQSKRLSFCVKVAHWLSSCWQAVAVARQYLQEDKADLTCQPAFRDG